MKIDFIGLGNVGGIQLELAPLLVDIFRDGAQKYGARDNPWRPSWRG